MGFYCDEGVSFEFSEVETRDLLSTKTKNGRTLSLKLKRPSNDNNVYSSKSGRVSGTLKRSDKTSAKVSAYFTQNNKNQYSTSPDFGKMTATLSGKGTIESKKKIGGFFGENSDDEPTDEFLTHDCTVTGNVKLVINYVSNTQKRKACRGAISMMGVIGWAHTTYSQPFIEKSKALGLSPEDCASVLGRTEVVVASKPKPKSVPFEWSDNDGKFDVEERRSKTAKARRQAERWEQRRKEIVEINRKAEEERRQAEELAATKREAEEKRLNKLIEELAEAKRKAKAEDRRRQEVAEAKLKAEEKERRRLELAEAKRNEIGGATGRQRVS
jgi:hypothetical protein